MENQVSPNKELLNKPVMCLKTLGTLELYGSSFCRTLPLTLLSYLSLEGPKDRRHLAELFWPQASDALNCLSVTLSRLRRSATGAMDCDDNRVWTTIPSDAQQALDAFEMDQVEQGVALYRGCFLDGFYLRTESPEFEDWVYQTREFLAFNVRNGLLELANRTAASGQFREASKLAERAYLLKGAPAAEPSTLGRLHTLMVAGNSFHTFKVRKEVSGYGLSLSASAQEARSTLLMSALHEPSFTLLETPSYKAA